LIEINFLIDPNI